MPGLCSSSDKPHSEGEEEEKKASFKSSTPARPVYAFLANLYWGLMMWADVRCAPSFPQHSYVCLCFYKRHVIRPVCACVYGSWSAGWPAGWLVWDAQKRCVNANSVRHKNIFTLFFFHNHTHISQRLQLVTAQHSPVQKALNTFHTLTFLTANNGEVFVCWSSDSSETPPLVLWLGSKPIMGGEGLKSFVGVIMGFPFQGNQELLQNKCPQLNLQQ